MIEIVSDYEKVLTNIDKIIEASPYKTDYIIDSLGISSANFYRKKREKNFSLSEMKRLAEIFSTDEMEDKLLGLYAEQIEKDASFSPITKIK